MDTELYAIVYDELKRIAHRHLHDVGGSETLSTTDLVHEAYLKLSHTPGQWENRAHFFGAASRAMRQVLVDFARRRQADKRGGSERDIVTLKSSDAALELELDEMLALDSALDRLNEVDPRLHHVVELRFFGGLSAAEIGELLDVTPRTVERDWVKARLFLLRELDPERESRQA